LNLLEKAAQTVLTLGYATSKIFGIRRDDYFYIILANRGPALPGKNSMRLSHQSGHFTLHKVFSPIICLGFGILGYTGVRMSGWQGHSCVKNFLRESVEVCTKFGGH